MTLLASLLFADKPPPNLDALALSPTIGWILLACVVCAFALFAVQGDRWRRFWMVCEDPRSIGFMRIVFGFFIICNVNDLWEHFRMLFTDEGVFTADVARAVHASGQFKGFGDGFLPDEPWGFFDNEAIWHYLTDGHKYSLLHFWDSPTFFWGHLWAFQLCGALFMIGLWSRFTGVITFFLMMSIFFRSHMFWEGTEVVYIVFFVYLLFAKSGHAYSVDNWLRCRKLRKQGLLSERDGPGNGAGIAPNSEYPKGLQAIYRLIPAWPRRLMMLQMCTIMTTTGILKNGSVWARGDAIYYAWNLDHFYRFYPQEISSIIGTNVLRLMTWFAHWGEVFCSVMMIGVVLKWAQSQPPLRKSQRWAMRAAFAALIGLTCWMVYVAWPVHITRGISVWWFVGGWLTVWAVIWGVFWFFTWHPVTFTVRRSFFDKTLVRIGLGIVAAALVAVSVLYGMVPLSGTITILWLTIPAAVIPVALWVLWRHFGYPDKTFTLDREWIRAWTVGRRIGWTTLVGIMGGIFVLMNIGQFQTGMLSAALAFIHGEEIAKTLRFIGKRLPTWVPGIPADVRRGEPMTPAEDPLLPRHHRDLARLPWWVILTLAGGLLAGVIRRGLYGSDWPYMRYWYIGAGILLVVTFLQWLGHRNTRMPDRDPETGNIRMPWAYGPFGRAIAMVMLLWHIAAVAIWLLPDKSITKEFRTPARNFVGPWLRATYTTQGWGMFAPNPPRRNVFLKVLVTDEKGEVFDLKTDLYHPDKVAQHYPFIWNDRMRKMNRRMVGKGKMYRKWYSRFICREWQREHNGEIPEKVELVKYTYRIPTPEEVATKGWYKPLEQQQHNKREVTIHTETCKTTVMGQMPNEHRARYGLPPLPEGVEYKRWIKHKRKKWEREKERKAKKAEAKNKKGSKKSVKSSATRKTAPKATPAARAR